VTGTLAEAAGSVPVYDVKGQAYNGGDVSLHFKRRGARSFTDDIDGRIKAGTLIFEAKLDPSPKKCSYRFAVARSS
jgi:hypothetical protein